MKRIKLPSHDGSRNYIEQVADNQWKLVPQYDWTREIYDGEKHTERKLMAVDPSGGPMISVGENIYGLIVESIAWSDKHHAYVFTMSGEYKKT